MGKKLGRYQKLVDLNPDSQYTKLQTITEKLMKRVLKIYDSEKQNLLQVSWLSSAYYKLKQGYVLLEFSPYLKPYLLQLKSHFTKIDIVDTLKLKSIYAIRVFELLLQYVSIGSREISIIDLRSYCGIEQIEYKDYFDLKRYVIEKAKKEINKKTEYNIDYREIKESRKIVAIEWTIYRKDLDKQAHLERLTRLSKELRSEDVVIDNLMEYGFGKTIAKRLLKLHTEQVVKDAIRAVDIQIARGKVKNPKAMLQTAIVEKWHPDKYKAR